MDEPKLEASRFAPTPREQAHLQQILDWQEHSAKCNMVFGPSIECPNCHVTNNPNNPRCYQCGRSL